MKVWNQHYMDVVLNYQRLMICASFVMVCDATNNDQLFNITALHAHQNVIKCTIEQGNSVPISKMSNGDMTAQVSKYLAGLYNKSRYN